MKIKFEQKLIIPKKINRTMINGKTYATDINGKGLFLLINNNNDEDEGILIDKSFTIKNLKNASNEIISKIKNSIDII